MKYSELLQLYFDRSNALQWYWTIYVVVIGGLLAFSSLRKRPDLATGILVTVLYLCFAYKNMGAIEDVSLERFAILSAMKEIPTWNLDPPGTVRSRALIEPTLRPPELAGVKQFHIASDLLTVLALWAMEWRRRKAAGEEK